MIKVFKTPVIAEDISFGIGTETQDRQVDGLVVSGVYHKINASVIPTNNPQTGTIQDALDDRYTKLESDNVLANDTLTKNNTQLFTPSGNYNPATKLYVDQKVVAIGAGDMAQAVYDTNGSGSVDKADRVGSLTDLDITTYVDNRTVLVTDSLYSESTINALSANQGKVLNDIKVNLSGDNKMLGSLRGPEGVHQDDYVTKSQLDKKLDIPVSKQVSAFKKYGGQLERLYTSLSNPLEQFTSISFIGDSITWGVGILGGLPTDPRVGGLKDTRAGYNEENYVNIIKRYIRDTFFDGDAGVVGNWSFSVGGESNITYTKRIELYPVGDQFTISTVGVSSTVTEIVTANAIFDRRYSFDMATINDYSTLSFTVTGTQFELFFTSLPTSSKYEVIVDGVSIGLFDSDTGVVANKQSRVHNFGYIRDKVVEIKSVYNTAKTGVQALQIEAIGINKKVLIENQGVSGITTERYNAYNFGQLGPSVITPETNYVFVQLGTNDRVKKTDVTRGMGITDYEKNMEILLTNIGVGVDVILMNANMTQDFTTTMFDFHESDIKTAVHKLAKKHSLDWINNYSIFRGVNLDIALADGLHPSSIGHEIIAENIVSALENA